MYLQKVPQKLSRVTGGNSPELLVITLQSCCLRLCGVVGDDSAESLRETLRSRR